MRVPTSSSVPTTGSVNSSPTAWSLRSTSEATPTSTPRSAIQAFTYEGQDLRSAVRDREHRPDPQHRPRPGGPCDLRRARDDRARPASPTAPCRSRSPSSRTPATRTTTIRSSRPRWLRVRVGRRRQLRPERPRHRQRRRPQGGRCSSRAWCETGLITIDVTYDVMIDSFGDR